MTGRQDVVLVVDSDLAVREALKFALEIEGFAVYLCADGPELLAHPELRLADCLVLDDKLPLMDGASVLDRLVEGNFQVPVILMTNHATDGLRRRAIVAGVRHILEKPLLNGGLVESIHDVVGHRSSPIG
jgi:two-component system, LuxR family, response regulator FixJ